jgi:hypothetical protein
VAAAAAALILSVTLVAQKKDDKKQAEARKKEIQGVVMIAEAVGAGQPAPTDLALTWVHEDFLKAQNNHQYVPFTLSIDTAGLTGSNVALYWRVDAQVQVQGLGALLSPPADAQDDKKDKQDAPSRHAYEDISFVPVKPDQGVLTLSRSFTVPAGTYDVCVVVKESEPADKKGPAPKAAALKRTITVPDYWNSEFSTSSIIVADGIQELSTALSPQEIVERPYALGTLEIVPALDTVFTRKNELSVFMMIYNTGTDSMNKPDVVVEYHFYAKPAGQAEKFFNKTNPQNLNAQTLPPQFNLAQGYQLQAGQAVSLASFPEGDYRLKITVTDKIANKSLTRDLDFTVTAG